MAEKRIDELPAAAAVGDGDLLVLEQTGEAKKLEGNKLKEYVTGAVQPLVDKAKEHAEAAQGSATAAASAAQAAEAVVPDMQQYVDDAITAQSAVIAQQKMVNDKQTKQIDTLYKLLEGQELDFDTQTQTAYELPIESAKGEVMGASALDMLGGMDMKWNQLVDKSAFASDKTHNGIVYTVDKINGTVSANGTATENSYIVLERFTERANHKYYFCGCPKGGSQSTYCLSISVSDYGNGAFERRSTDATFNIAIEVKNGTTVSNLVFKPMIFDLTAMGMDDITSVTDPRIAMIESIAQGRPQYDEGSILTAQTSEIVAKKADGTVLGIATIPQDCPALHGINDSVYDYIEFADDKVLLHKRVGVVDLGSLEFSYYIAVGNNPNRFAVKYSSLKNNGFLLCDKYPQSFTLQPNIDNVCSSASGYITIVDSAYTDVTLFKNMLISENVTMCYELATEQILDVTDIFKDFDNLIPVEDGGTLTFKNSAENEAQGIHIPVPSTVTYPVRLGV